MARNSRAACSPRGWSSTWKATSSSPCKLVTNSTSADVRAFSIIKTLVNTTGAPSPPRAVVGPASSVGPFPGPRKSSCPVPVRIPRELVCPRQQTRKISSAASRPTVSAEQEPGLLQQRRQLEPLGHRHPRPSGDALRVPRREHRGDRQAQLVEYPRRDQLTEQ